MDNVLLLLTNLPDAQSARNIARHLIEQRAAACVNILPQCSAVYQWQGKIEEANEVPLLIKTTESAYVRAEKIIREHHPYELPEIIAVPVVAGLPAYLQWVHAETLN